MPNFQHEQIIALEHKLENMRMRIMQLPQNFRKKKSVQQALARITALITALMMMTSTIGEAKAITVEEFIKDSDGIFYLDYNGNVVTKKGGYTDKTIWTTLEDVINSSLRVCSAYEVRTAHHAARDESQYIFFKKDIMKVIDRATYIENWCKENVPEIVADGLTRDEAILTVFNYIIDNYEYDNKAVSNKDKDTLCEEQGGYHMLTTGVGICTSYAKVFRAIIEAIPFNDEYIVDWDLKEEEAKHIPVTLVSCETHIWAAIEDPETEELRHYDLTFADKFSKSIRYLDVVSRYYDSDLETITKDKVHGDPEKLLYYH